MTAYTYKSGKGIPRIGCASPVYINPLPLKIRFGPGRGGQQNIGQGIDAGTGNPAPSLKMDRYGKYRFPWIVDSGARTISVQVMQPKNTAPYPTLKVKANTDIGVNADVVGTSAGGAGWVTIGPITITPASNGAVYVELQNWQPGYANCWWDNVSVT